MSKTYTDNYNLEKHDNEEFYDIFMHAGNMDIIDAVMKVISDKQVASLKFPSSSGSGTSLVVATGTFDLIDGQAFTFIPHAGNGGLATTINADGKGARPLYKPATTNAPSTAAGKPITVWYNLAGDCFFFKASAEGNAIAAHVLAPNTFSNGDDVGIVGTMANRGAINYTPTTVNQPIAAGYHDGTGLVAGDADLVSANIKAGINIFGVAGKTQVVDTTEATLPASTGHIINGRVTFVNGAKVTGTMVDRTTGTYTADEIIAGAGYIDLGVPDSAFYGDSARIRYADADFAEANIKEGVNLFGKVGTLKPAPVLTAGENLIFQDTATKMTTGTTQTKLFEKTLNILSGTLRIKFGLRTNNASYTAVARIYRNGVAVGTLQYTTNTNTLEFIEDVSGWNAGDLIQIYAWSTSASGTSILDNNYGGIKISIAQAIVS